MFEWRGPRLLRQEFHFRKEIVMFREKPSASAYDRIVEAINDIGERISDIEEQVAERIHPTPSRTERIRDAVSRNLPALPGTHRRRSYLPEAVSSITGFAAPALASAKASLSSLRQSLPDMPHSVSEARDQLPEVHLPRWPALRRNAELRSRTDYLRDHSGLSTVLIAGGAIAAVGVAYYVTKKLADYTEEPDYEVVRQDGDVEIRDYDAMVLAETVKSGYHEKARRSGFETLYNYIRAQNRGGKKIAMTAPVLQQLAESDGRTKGWGIRFVMPKKYTASTLPAPASEDVEIKEVPARRVVAITFPGNFTASLASKKLMTLYNYLADENLVQKGDPEYAFYNPPWTPGFMRRNEIWIEIER
ncbi:SOUL family heme-binding protein [Consotaella aegiceratis]|uniref:SOUL family heme-binding protein n=1 Tax=Consotaella aegiceratis TaxID=3097961 RepID=UPI002F410D86